MKLVLFLFVIYFSAVNSAADEDDASSKPTNATADFLKSSLNESINPCNDFYKFACGGILKTNTRQKYRIPTIYKHFERMLNASVSSNDAIPFRFLKQYYKACLKAEITLKDDVEAVKKILKQLGGWPLLDGDDWDEASFDPNKFVYKARKLGFFYNSIISVNPRNKAFHVDYGRLGLNQWSLRLGLNNTHVKQYFGLLVEMAMMFGASKENAQTEIKNALNFEIQLAKIMNDTVKYQPLPLKTVQKAYPNIPWQEFLETIIDCSYNNLSTNSLIYVLRPRYLTRLQAILCSTPKKDQANYMVYRGLLEIIKTYFPSKLSATSLRLLYPYHTNYSQISRSTKCTSMITLSFHHAAILMRARNIISEATKQNTKELITCIKSAFVSMLNHIDWMDEKTKTAATEKVSAMNATIGYPDKFMSNEHLNQIYSKLNASSNNFIDLILAGQKFLEDKKFEDSARLAPRDLDLMTYLNNPNVLHIPNKNGLHIQAEILQTPVYDGNRPNYMNYGSLGLFISRAITDSVGERGRMHDKNGLWKPWWTTDTTVCYSKKRACFANQYLNYTKTEPKTKIYGHSYANENILDHTASEAAYVAYTNWAQAHGEESGLSNLKYTPKQLFWISTANTFCSLTRRHFGGGMWPVPYNYHYHRVYVPDMFRIIGAIRNSDNFAKDFNCPCGSPQKCKVWDNK